MSTRRSFLLARILRLGIQARGLRRINYNGAGPATRGSVLWRLLCSVPILRKPNLWLTDYLLSTSLQEAYQERMDAGRSRQCQAPPASRRSGSRRPGGPYSRVKQVISDEIRQQLAQESAESQSPRPPERRAKPRTDCRGAAAGFIAQRAHIFIVSALSW